jgi:hypothetical protein
MLVPPYNSHPPTEQQVAEIRRLVAESKAPSRAEIAQSDTPDSRATVELPGVSGSSPQIQPGSPPESTKQEIDAPADPDAMQRPPETGQSNFPELK